MVLKSHSVPFIPDHLGVSVAPYRIEEQPLAGVPPLAAQGGSFQVSCTGRTSQERNSERRWKRWREQSGCYRRKAESYCKLCHKVSCKQWTNIIGFKLLFPIFPSHQLTFESQCLIFHLSHYRILKPSIHSFILLVYCLCKSTRTALQFFAMPFWISKLHHKFFHSWGKKKNQTKPRFLSSSFLKGGWYLDSQNVFN